MDPGSAFFRVIAGLATEKQQQGGDNNSEQPARRRSSISDLISSFSKLALGGGGGTGNGEENKEEKRNDQSQSRKSIDKTHSKQENLEKARRMSIAILQTIRNTNATADPTLIDVNEQQKQIDEAIKIFEKMEMNNDNFDWNDAFNTFESRMAQQQAYRNQPYNRNYQNDNNGQTYYNGANNQTMANTMYNNNNNNNNTNNNNNQSNLNNNNDTNNYFISNNNSSNVRMSNDGRYDVNNTRFVELKENENHGIFDSIKSVGDNRDEYMTTDGLFNEVKRLQNENNYLKQQLIMLASQNDYLADSKLQLINNMSKAMEQSRAMVRNYNKLLNDKK